MLLPATPGCVSLPVAVGVPRHSWLRVPGAVPRHSWLGFAVGGGGCSSPLLAEGPGCGSPPLLAGVRWRRWCVVCGVWCVVCGVNQTRKMRVHERGDGYLGFDVGYGWCKPAASKMQPLQDMQIRNDPKKGLQDARSFVGACNFHRRHIHKFTYSSAPLTDLIKKTTPWRRTAREEDCFQELKKKIASSNCLGVPRPKGEIVLITDASDVGGGGMIYQWQELNPAELTH